MNPFRMMIVPVVAVVAVALLVGCDSMPWNKDKHDDAKKMANEGEKVAVAEIAPAGAASTQPSWGKPAGAITFTQMGTWAEIKFKGSFPQVEPIAEVWASQFDWRVRYPGPDGRVGTMDDIESPFEFVVPVGEPVRFQLRSRDVIHSFFVPYLRIKQDAMPGMSIPVWFQAEKEGSYDLVCAELCGWGHYKMAGRLKVLSRPAYDAWLKQARTEMLSNGSEDKS